MSKSAVSRRFKAATQKELKASLSRPLGRIPLVAIMLEAEKGFRRIRGYEHLPLLVAALRAHDAKLKQEIDPLQQVA